jgi:hypothetical protein
MDLNIKDNLLMDYQLEEENLLINYFVFKVSFMKECFKDKEWYFINQEKYSKDFCKKIVWKKAYINIQMVIFIKECSNKIKNQVKVNTIILMGIIIKELLKKENDLVMV